MADGFRVGAVGTSPLSMDPKLLLQLLTAKREESMQASRSAKEAAERERLLAMLAPGERRDAELFGLDYVARQRQFGQAREIEKRQRREDVEREEKRLGERQLAEDVEKREAAQSKEAEKRRLIESLLGPRAAGVLAPGPVAGAESYRIPGEREQAASAQLSDVLARGRIPGMGVPAQHLGEALRQQIQQEQAGPQRYRVIPEWERRIILQAGGQIPQGMIGEDEFRQLQQAEAARARAEQISIEKRAGIEKKKSDLARQIQDAHTLLAADGYTPEMIARWDQSLAAKGISPQNIKREMEAVRKRAEADEKRGEASRAAIFNLEKQINDVDFELAETEEAFPGEIPQPKIKAEQRDIKIREKRLLERRLLDLLLSKIRAGKDTNEEAERAMRLAAELGIVE